MIELKTCDVTTDEQETTITFGRKDDRATIWCNDPTILTKISKVLNAEGSQWKLEDTVLTKDKTVAGYQFSCPKKMIKFVAKGKQLSDEQRAALRDRLAKAKDADASDDDDE